MITRRYEYKTMRADQVYLITHVPVPSGSYLSEDGPVVALRELLAAGFRWVRTDNYEAVFERCIEEVAPADVSTFDSDSAQATPLTIPKSAPYKLVRRLFQRNDNLPLSSTAIALSIKGLSRPQVERLIANHQEHFTLTRSLQNKTRLWCLSDASLAIETTTPKTKGPAK